MPAAMETTNLVGELLGAQTGMIQLAVAARLARHLLLCDANLFRLFRLLRYGHRLRPANGISFSGNFDQPYRSQNISEFWRRWHMTLTRWSSFVLVTIGWVFFRALTLAAAGHYLALNSPPNNSDFQC
jgi:D-alanyl-lipoteichoic acid acyltransferase DltB (MBOAT superfamily)